MRSATRISRPGSGVPDGELLGPGPDPDAGHLIGFTSGTESQPKGCFHTWNSYSFTPRTQRLLYEVTPDDIALVVSPPTHTSGLAAGLLKPLVSGAAACLMPKWSPQEALRLIGRHRVTMATGATPFIAMLAEAYDPAVHDVSSFRMFLCGGAPVPAALIARVRQTLGTTKVLPVYGQTESLILTTCLSADTDERAATSSGRAVPGAQVAIVGPAGTPLPAGETGEIWYRTPGAMLGYWRNPEASAAAIESDGWRHSGDLGYLDAAGYLQITGRIKDMIIRGGVNISSREVEEMLEQHPRVAAAAIVGDTRRPAGGTGRRVRGGDRGRAHPAGAHRIPAGALPAGQAETSRSTPRAPRAADDRDRQGQQAGATGPAQAGGSESRPLTAGAGEDALELKAGEMIHPDGGLLALELAEQRLPCACRQRGVHVGEEADVVLGQLQRAGDDIPEQVCAIGARRARPRRRSVHSCPGCAPASAGR